MKQIIYTMLAIALLGSCKDQMECNNEAKVFHIEMKYISFDLEVENDNLPDFDSVRYHRDFHGATIIFKNDESTPNYAAPFIVSIYSPTSATNLNQTFDLVDYDKNKLQSQSIRRYNGTQSLFVSRIYYRPAIRVNVKLIDESGKLDSLHSDCYPSVKVKNIVFDDRYESWFDSDWFSLEGIDSTTVLE